MKPLRSLFIAFAAIALLASCSDDEPRDYERLGFTCKVKSVKDSYYSATEKFGEEVAEELEEVYITEFNERGNVLSFTEYDEERECVGKTTFKYNDDDHISELVIYSDSGKPWLRQTKVWDGDKIMGVTTTRYHDGMEIKSIEEYSYDGDKIKKAVYKDEATGISGEWVYKYEGKNISEIARYDETGELEGYTRYSDYKGKVATKIEETGRDGQVARKVTVDEKNRLLSDEIDGLLAATVKYDENGNPQMLSNARLDKNGTVYSAYIRSDADPEVWKFTYTFDKKGNWTQRHDYRNGELKTIVKRKIEY